MIVNFTRIAIITLTALLTGCIHTQPEDDGVSIQSLRQKKTTASLSFVKNLVGNEKYQALLMSFEADHLKQFALVLKPTAHAHENGYPVVIFAHGFHPEPEKYGISTSTGEDWRPGDYYRGVPERYAEKGFLVLAPDYRGHNTSEGYDFTQSSFLATSYYASDVLHLLSALSSLPDANLGRVYFVGHSMGGDVGLKVLLATNKIHAASLWSPVAATTHQQALYYGRYYDKTNVKVNRQTMAQYLDKIDKIYAQLPTNTSFEQVDPTFHLDELNTPLIIHHARGDESVPYIWSENLVAKLHKKNKSYDFYVYDSDKHLFAAENREKAIERDIRFFGKYSGHKP